jgi:hypothetical protein
LFVNELSINAYLVLSFELLLGVIASLWAFKGKHIIASKLVNEIILDSAFILAKK